MADDGATPPWRSFGQGYGPLIAVMAALVVAALVIPALNVIDSAPAQVSEADIARLRSEAALWRSDPSSFPGYPARVRGPMPACQRDRMALSVAQALGLPKSQLRRVEYVELTDCHGQD
jgi:hypothetical protein